MALDFSKVVSRNPLSGGSTRHQEASKVRLDFSVAMAGTESEEVRDRRRAMFVARVQEQRVFAREFDRVFAEETKPIQEASDRHATSLAFIERGRVMREHANGGDALYAEVERILALPVEA